MIKFKVFNGCQDNKSVYGQIVWVDDLANEWLKIHPYYSILDMQYQCCVVDEVIRERLCVMYDDGWEEDEKDIQDDYMNDYVDV